MDTVTSKVLTIAPLPREPEESTPPARTRLPCIVGRCLGASLALRGRLGVVSRLCGRLKLRNTFSHPQEDRVLALKLAPQEPYLVLKALDQLFCPVPYWTVTGSRQPRVLHLLDMSISSNDVCSRGFAGRKRGVRAGYLTTRNDFLTARGFHGIKGGRYQILGRSDGAAYQSYQRS